MTGRRASILRELGLAPLWRLRSRAEAAEVLEEAGDKRTSVPEVLPAVPAAVSAERGPPPIQPAVRSMPAQAFAPVAVSSGPPPQPGPASPSAASGTPVERRNAATLPEVAGLDWDALEAAMRACNACRLCEQRQQAVPGVGDRRARWLFVGEAPGREEDQRGEPFVGQAGRLLDRMLAAIGLQRGEDVYIANAVKCRPPHNRTPAADEMAACRPYLRRQIELLQPALIVALGRPAAFALLGEELRISAARGKLFAFEGIPVVVSYHPAYLLRNPLDKARVWEDLCFARRQMAAISAAQGRGQ